ncbi:GtrA family protein [Streptococcus pluranimalium]|uniref:GtrA family protein n=1 Tax=Streptococcus pluranimalium TaxID=82348 RepID=UPI0039FD6C5C
MKYIKALWHHEVTAYLFFGGLATLVYLTARTILFSVSRQATLAAVVANAIAILFAFFTNDRWVFKQERRGWQKRLVTFTGARLSTLILDLVLAEILVERFPAIIGQFVDHHLAKINLIESLIAQILIIIINYMISKYIVFKHQKTS